MQILEELGYLCLTLSVFFDWVYVLEFLRNLFGEAIMNRIEVHFINEPEKRWHIVVGRLFLIA